MNETPPGHPDPAAPLAAPYGERLQPFLEAVVEQVAVPTAEALTEGEGAEREQRTAAEVLELLHAARATSGRPADARPGSSAAERLRANPPLLAAFFQNIDLLYQREYPHADAVAMLVMRALEQLDDLPADRG